ncbi:MAG: hypothetical protein CL858_16555 [Cupriavidus sp.]|nr:hypothetical protein [Cupriavidus sp.]
MTNTSKPSKKLRADVVALQKRSVQVLLTLAENSDNAKSHRPVRSAYKGEISHIADRALSNR